MTLHYLLFYLLLVTCVLMSYKLNKLTLIGSITGGIIAVMVFYGAGYAGITMLGTFFIMGTMATNYEKEKKQTFKQGNQYQTKRNTGQVLANGGMAAILGGLILLMPAHAKLLNLLVAACLASAMADTLSSELGIIWGNRFYNIITWQKDRKGLDGVISLEGTLIGTVGSAAIAMIYAISFGWTLNILFIIISGTIGNLGDSVMGALLERKGYLNNDMVNFLNTLIAAVICLFLATIFQ